MPNPSSTRIGIDTGGTFTDFVHLTPEGILTVAKLRSTPDDPSRAILEGIRTLPSSRTALEITHGSTVATNALLERKGADIALVTTAGFEDVLLIGRQTRRELYNFQVEAPRPLVTPAQTFGVPERMLADGTVLEPLTQAAIATLIEQLRTTRAESVAICLLHSYANPAHEQALAAALRAAGYLVSASHEILPEYREFERWSTTAVNAYVAPLMSRYFTRLSEALQQGPAEPCALIPAPSSAPSLRIMQSNGGSISAAEAGRAAVQTILSGPAAGVVGAQAIANAAGYTRLITFDMGGTSTDVALIDERIATTNDSLVGDLPVRLPVLDIHTVGAGGGSIAWLDAGGALRVGPRSAGAQPGPACYGSGQHLTVTDANLLLGRLDPAFFLGGRMTLDLPRAQGIAAALAAQLSLTPNALCEGIVRMANSNMERAIRKVSVERGHHPRDFSLVAFGGAGGLHACALGAALDLRTVLIPRHAGVLSALGMLLADVVKDFSAALLQPAAGLTYPALEQHFRPLLEQAQTAIRLEGFPLADILLQPTLDMRYQGQAYELKIPFEPDFKEAFHRAHFKLYGYSNPARPTEIVQLRVQATGRTDKPQLTSRHTAATPQPPPLPTSTRQTQFDGRPHTTPIYHQDQLSPGTEAQGPAILLTAQATNIIPPGWHWQIDPTETVIAKVS